MQTFLPYSSFKASAKVLDRQRLGKQRVECLQILNVLFGVKSSWANHPAVLMWKGYEGALIEYSLTICEEWTSRGYKDTCAAKIFNLAKANLGSYLDGTRPIWLGDEEFHASHRSNLLRKKPEWYREFGWKESDDLPYVWPSKLK